MAKQNKKYQKHNHVLQNKKSPAKPSIKSYTNYIILSAILLLTFIVFKNSLNNGFMTSWDDNKFITENESIRNLNFEAIKQFFTTAYFENYHPLTMLSYAIEFKLFGLIPKPFHTTNLIFHLLNVMLVFYFIQMLTKRIEISTIATIFFAVHPMHVESVAWLSERKDVMYAFFFLGSLIAYLYYLKNSSKLKYLVYCFILFAASLMSKSAAAPLPLILVLIDYFYSRKIFSKQVIIEKIPFFILAFIFGIIAIINQKSAGALNMAPVYPFYDKFFLISHAIIFYVIKMLVPINLCSLYYYPIATKGILPLEYYFDPLIIILIIFGIFKSGTFKKYLIWGMLFYLSTIFMVIQIIPLGRSITADRYTYIPLIGLSVILGYFYVYLIDKNKKFKPVLNIIIVGCVIFCSITAWNRNKVWMNGRTLYADVVEKNPGEWHGWAALGYAKMEDSYDNGTSLPPDYQGAIDDYDKSLKLYKYAESFNNRGNARYKLNNFKGAILDYNKALETDSTYPLAYYNRGSAIEQLNQDYPSAIKDYTKAIQFDPKYMLAYNSRGLARYRLNDFEGAIEDCNKAIQLAPNYPNAYQNRGIIKFSQKKYQEAIEDYSLTIQLNPDFALAYSNRGVAKYYLNDKKGACMDWEAAAQKGNKEAEGYMNSFCK